ncbi:MAG TPA: polysaccharide ABC transporter ATP-binding protein [Mucilaginibacter sp.]|jgi:ABC-type polysaccharide/polyol phosphate transport system ATPase subunit|nr:polysaccharide ABC transporter ATP-binding protein [Mucilaginibacter sp.]
MPKAIQVSNLSKAYRLGEIGTGTISRDLERFFAKVRGREDPFLKIAEANDRSTRGESDVIFSLRDLNFDIEQGNTVGIIGRNGAGKSTLLKILSRVTAPTTGSVKLRGRVASLLEVGTGFHPDLTGRENIYLNGAILGMRKAEIKRKFDEIVDFSGVERYIDTPVKRYSSGMYVRLAFAVAAHLESEIMIVDEVLAVGDAEFQRKCLGKMGDISKGEGRTVLFVSHNMAAVQRLCKTAIFLNNGIINSIGTTSTIIEKYLQNSTVQKTEFVVPLPIDHESMICYATKLQIENIHGEPLQEIPLGSPWQISISFKLNENAQHFIIALGLTNQMDINLRTSWSEPQNLTRGFYTAVFKEEKLLLSSGQYSLTIGLSIYERPIHYVENVASFIVVDILDPTLDRSIIKTTNVGLLLNPMEITIITS